MSSQPQPFRSRLDDLWVEYVTALEKSQRSKNIQDGIEAGRAWSRWLCEFLPPGDRSAAHTERRQ